jgi:phenylalanyl-tRNA synthetase beta chain
VAGVHQPMRIAGLAYGPAEPVQWGRAERAADYFDAKADVEALFAPRRAHFVAAEHPALHPGRSARIELAGRSVGWIGELHPKWRQAYDLPHAPQLFEIELDALTVRDVPAYQPIARQQSVWRDLALVVSDHLSHDRLIAAIGDDLSGLVRSAQLFDIYKPKTPGGDIGANERSMAVRIELLDDDTTLTDERIDGAVAAVVERLHATLGARLRA